MRRLTRLTDQQIALLVEWLGQEGHITAAEIARRLGRPYFTVAKAVQRVRQRGGWYTVLEWGTCTECGQDLPMSTNYPRTAHVHCERARIVRYSRQCRERRPGQSTPYVRAYRDRHPELLPAKRERAREYAGQRWPSMSEQERREWLDRLHGSDKRDYPITLELAESRGDLWSPDEEAYILEHWHEPARDVGLALGRTLWGIRGRKVVIRRRKEKAGEILPRSNRRA